MKQRSIRKRIWSSLAVATFLIGLTALRPQQASATSAKTLEVTGWSAGTTSLTLTFDKLVSKNLTVVVMVAYKNSANTGQITASGLGATWVPGYQPATQSGMGIAVLYGTVVTGGLTQLTITAPVSDNLRAIAETWSNLTIVEDANARSIVAGSGTQMATSLTTVNANDVIFNPIVYGGTATPSPPQGYFRPAQGVTNHSKPYLVGNYDVVGAAGSYSNDVVLGVAQPWISATVALESGGVNSPPFAATPLIDFAPDELYLGKFPGLLYNNSNTMSADHDADGRAFAAQVTPLDGNGNPSSTGKIGLVTIGMSNWHEEICSGSTTPTLACDPNTFFDQARSYSNLNPNLVLVDCGEGKATAEQWANPDATEWSDCVNTLATVYGLTPKQVQVLLWKNGNHTPVVSLSSLSGSACPANPNQTTDPDACTYEQNVALTARKVKTLFPNVKQMFLQSRVYAGYAPSGAPHRDPFSYEYGFSTKWLIQAQINQVAGGGTDPLAGDLSYASAPWLAWGPYFWASGATPNSIGTVWLGGDITSDGVHTSICKFYGITCGRKKVGDLMMSFYTTSPYSPWFLATSSAASATAVKGGVSRRAPGANP